ncbi:exported hypothetical protein [Candidatus Terasakiella magnetica]|nr:exported hypothetical protein [Candidatus Terasakiella magnetica]
MTACLRASLALLALCLAGCIPFVLENQSTHFASSEYSYPLTDGLYVLEGFSGASIRVATQPDQVTITMTQGNGEEVTMIGGFIALAASGHFIFQVTDASQKGKAPDNKKPGESLYVPMRITSSDEVNWFPGPERNDLDISRLLQVHGLASANNGEWTARKNLSKTQVRAFYEELAPLLDRTTWRGTRMRRVAGS